jgi:hypothetical protein
MKKILTVVLLWTALCGTAFSQNASDFTVDAKGVITKYIGFDTDVVIPATIGGKSITAIGKEAFKKNDLTSVTIPNSVTEIGESAFAQNQLTKVTIGTGVKTIGKSAFADNKLTSVTIPNGEIGESAFAQNQLTSVTIGNDVTNIGKSAFSGNNFTSITIPNGDIGESAFDGMQLTSVTFGNGVKSIGKSAFSGNKLTSVTVPCSVGERAFYGNPLATIVISEGASYIRKEAFANTKCTSVSLSSTLEDIDATSFDTSGKPSFKLAANINASFSFFPMFYSYIANDSKAGTFAFDTQAVQKSADDFEYYETQYGAVLTNYTGNSTRVRIPAEIGGVPVKALFGTFNKKSIEAVQIPEKITYIGEKTFAESTLAGLTIPKSVTFIGALAFYRCSITNVTLPTNANFTRIGDNAFCGCGRLTSIIIPNSVTSIGFGAFDSCTSLTSITIPSSVKSIGNSAFNGCTGLTSMTFQGTIPSSGFDQKAFTNIINSGNIGDLRQKFYASNSTNGTPGTYTRQSRSLTWTKQ